MQMLNLYMKLRSLTTRQEGQGMVEYALILVLVSIVVIVGLLLAILAGAGVFFLGGSIGGAGGIGGAPTTTVVVAKQPIAMRHAITASDLETSKVSGSFTSVNNTYANASDVVNLIAQ